MGAAPIFIFEDNLQNKALSPEHSALTFNLVGALKLSFDPPLALDSGQGGGIKALRLPLT